MTNLAHIFEASEKTRRTNADGFRDDIARKSTWDIDAWKRYEREVSVLRWDTPLPTEADLDAGIERSLRRSRHLHVIWSIAAGDHDADLQPFLDSVDVEISDAARRRLAELG